MTYFNALQALVKARTQCIAKDQLRRSVGEISERCSNVQSNQSHESKVISSGRCHDVVNRTLVSLVCTPYSTKRDLLIENRDRTSDSNNNQWLCCKNGKHHGSENRSKEYLINPITHIRFREPISKQSVVSLQIPWENIHVQ